MSDTSPMSLDSVIEYIPDRDVPCAFVTGNAGTGKTYYVRERIAADPKFAVLTATTGIAAVNLGGITIHSTLRYADTASLRDSFVSGRLQRVIRDIILAGFQWIAIDEVSMADAEQLDLWYRGVQEANRYRDVARPLGLMLVGDFAQLPPVKARWAFEASCWEEFAKHTTRLERVWRQDGGKFLDALNLAREGKGRDAADVLTSAGATWHTQVDTEFDGTTILPRNDQVDRYNAIGLDRVRGCAMTLESERWGKPRPEWENIPRKLHLKRGAYVMVLVNNRTFDYVNGDCGYVEEVTPEDVKVRILRTGKVESIPVTIRDLSLHDRPEGWSGDTLDDEDDVWHEGEFWHRKRRKFVVGQVRYWPLRLAYASTVHKSQGLTLDRVQVDVRDWFFGKAAMVYVALSRCRSLDGMRLVGQPEKFAMQCNIDPKIRGWL